MYYPTVVVQQHLTPVEKLLWSGQPPSGMLFGPIDVFMVPFSITWALLSIALEARVLSSSGIAATLLLGVPLTLIGFYLMFGRFIVDAKRRNNTFYGITNERVIVVSGLVNQSVKAMDVRTLTNVSITETANGWGTVTFGPPKAQNGRLPGVSGVGDSKALVFEEVPRVRDIYASIQEAQRTPA